MICRTNACPTFTLGFPDVLTRSPKLIVGLLLLVFHTGCGSEGGPMGTVSGKLTKGGQALAGITVSFVGDKGAGGGVTDAMGMYKFTAPVAVGTYRVSLTSVTAATLDSSGADYEAMMSGKKKPPAEPVDKVLDPKYHSTATSNLQFEVKVGENTIDIPIE